MKRAFTTREKVMLLVLTVLLIVIAYFKLILEPINNSIDEYQSETAAEQDEILQNTELLTRMNQMQKELEEIYAAGDPTPIPNYDNSGKLLVELNSILSASVDYSLDFGQVSALTMATSCAAPSTWPLQRTPTPKRAPSLMRCTTAILQTKYRTSACSLKIPATPAMCR